MLAHASSKQSWSGMGSPIVDEVGNLYLTQNTPSKPSELVSLAESGNQRWKIAIPMGTQYLDMTLGPDGNLYAIAQSGDSANLVKQLVAFDAATGATKPMSVTIPGLSRIAMPADGVIYALTWTEAAGYGFQAIPMAGGAPVWTKTYGGDAYALSPAGDQLVMIKVGQGAPAPPLEIVALDPKTGAERWNFALDAGLGSPTIAIDTDGSVYAAASQNGSDLTVWKLSSTGNPLWGSVMSSLTWPRRILIGNNSVTVGAQANYNGAGVTLEKASGDIPAGWEMPCGEPEAIDANDVQYWGCDGGVQAVNKLGEPVGGWEGRYSFQVVLAPNQNAYMVPAAYFADHQMFRIR